MPWRGASGRERCNDCRRVPDLGAPVWRGEHTPAIWCEPCAETVGFGGGDAVARVDALAGLDKRKLAAAFPEFTAAMRALKSRASMRIAAGDVSARILGERSE